ncbi:hypothetical protein AAG906_035447 [Vitis piasezkii]
MDPIIFMVTVTRVMWVLGDNCYKGHKPLPEHKPPTPIGKPPKGEKPPPEHKPPTPVGKPPKGEKPPHYGHNPGHPPVESKEDSYKPPHKIEPPSAPKKPQPPHYGHNPGHPPAENAEDFIKIPIPKWTKSYLRLSLRGLGRTSHPSAQATPLTSYSHPSQLIKIEESYEESWAKLRNHLPRVNPDCKEKKQRGSAMEHILDDSGSSHFWGTS